MMHPSIRLPSVSDYGGVLDSAVSVLNNVIVRGNYSLEHHVWTTVTPFLLRLDYCNSLLATYGLL